MIQNNVSEPINGTSRTIRCTSDDYHPAAQIGFVEVRSDGSESFTNMTYWAHYEFLPKIYKVNMTYTIVPRRGVTWVQVHCFIKYNDRLTGIRFLRNISSENITVIREYNGLISPQ